MNNYRFVLFLSHILCLFLLDFDIRANRFLLYPDEGGRVERTAVSTGQRAGHTHTRCVSTHTHSRLHPASSCQLTWQACLYPEKTDLNIANGELRSASRFKSGSPLLWESSFNLWEEKNDILSLNKKKHKSIFHTNPAYPVLFNGSLCANNHGGLIQRFRHEKVNTVLKEKYNQTATCQRKLISVCFL